MPKLDEDEFIKALDHAIQDATHWQQATLNDDRVRNYQYYAGRMPAGPQGRSQATSWDVFETVESAMPDLVDIFLSGDNIAEFEPASDDPEDEVFAEQATQYINYIVQKQNPGFLIVNTWLKDAALSKVGVVRAYWAKSEKIKDREYTGLSEDQMTELVDDEDVEVIEQDSYPDPLDQEQRKEARKALESLPPDQAWQVQQMLDQKPRKLYDIKIRRKVKTARVYIDNVQPENFLITPRAKSIQGADLVGELKSMSRSDMREAGYSESDIEEAQSYHTVQLDDDNLAEVITDDVSDYGLWGDDDGNDEATEDVVVFDGFIRLDYDGDGFAEWRHVVRCGNLVLLNEPSEGPDFVILSPILIPHRAIGMAIADPVAPIQEISTAMQRQYIDSLMLANNPRTYAVENQVNLDDLLNNRVGGVVRVKNAGAVGPLITSNVATTALEGVEFMDSRREIRTGITRYNQGLDADSLNKTATGVSKIMSAGDKRKLMMARYMAETGMKDLFRLLLRIIINNQDTPSKIRLNKQWVTIDPSPWPAEMDVTIEVGQGSGDKAQTIGTLNMILQAQKEAMAAGLPIVDMKNLYNTMEAIIKAAGMKGADKYFNNPDNLPPPQPQQPGQDEQGGEMALAQATIEAEKIRAQIKREELQGTIALKQQEMQIKQIDLQIKQAELQLKREQAQHEALMKERERELHEAEFIAKAQTGNL